ncbi:hypothetical protein D1AOALGA4SA_5369, partial [Olavius algarvensis Delta 1 endosymbiont]
CYYEMRNPTSTDFQIDPQKFLLFDQTGCPLAGGCRSCETTFKANRRISNIEPQNVEFIMCLVFGNTLRTSYQDDMPLNTKIETLS